MRKPCWVGNIFVISFSTFHDLGNFLSGRKQRHEAALPSWAPILRAEAVRPTAYSKASRAARRLGPGSWGLGGVLDSDGVFRKLCVRSTVAWAVENEQRCFRHRGQEKAFQTGQAGVIA